MPIERLAALVLAVAIVVVILTGAPIAIPSGWDKAAHFAAFSALTLCLWQATGGRMTLFIVAAVIAFGALDEWRQAFVHERTSDAKDFLADLCAAVSTGALLLMQRKTACAESSLQ